MPKEDAAKIKWVEFVSGPGREDTSINGVIWNEIVALGHIYERSRTWPTSALLDAIDARVTHDRGKIVTTGMGKAGLAARKCASTFCAIGVPATYLHPGEAQHGDLGLLESTDVLLVFSTSGRTREVIRCLTLAKELRPSLTVCTITSHKRSKLCKMSDFVIDMGPIQEADEWGLLPTSSTICMLAISDALAVCLARQIGASRETFAMRHHAGYLGKKAREKA